MRLKKLALGGLVEWCLRIGKLIVRRNIVGGVVAVKVGEIKG